MADIAVLPRIRRQLIRLLQAFAREVHIEYPGLPVVAHSIHGTSELWEKSRHDHQRLGGAMATRIDSVTTRSGITASLVVWRHLRGDEAPTSTRCGRAARHPAESYRDLAGSRLAVSAPSWTRKECWPSADSWRRIEACHARPDGLSDASLSGRMGPRISR